MERQQGAKAQQAEQGRATSQASRAPARAREVEHPLLQLQMSAGNRAVGLFLRSLQADGEADGRPSSDSTDNSEAIGGATRAALEGGGGSPLPAPLRDSAGRVLGADLTRVRLHTDDAAARAADELRASAFTEGSDIYFGSGRFRPDTTSGRRLLLHELTHTVQQRHDHAGEPDARAPYTVSDPGEQAEAEARAIPQRAFAGETVSPASSVPARHIMRDYTPVPVVEPDEDDAGEYDEADVEVEDEDEEEAFLAPPPVTEFPLEVQRVGEPGGAESGPLVFVVPLGARRKEIARRLFDDAGRDKERAFDFVPAEGVRTAGGKPARAVRVRDLTQLSPAAAGRLRKELERELDEDVRWTIAKLSERIIDADDEMQLLTRAVKWSQRSDWTDENGVQYFERFLSALEARTMAEEFTGTDRNALQWLLIELEEKAGHLYTLLRHRTKREPVSARTGDKLGPDALITRGRKVSELGPDNVIGHYVQKQPDAPAARGRVVIDYVTVRERLLVETTRERAEIAARNATRLPRVVVPGEDGKFYVYSVNFPYFDEAKREQYASKNAPTFMSYWWVYPVAVFIRGGEFESDFARGGAAAREQRGRLLDAALAKATADDITQLAALDFDVLSLATFDQRVCIFKLVADSKQASGQQAFDLLTRLLYATPASEFPQFERRLSSEGVMAKLLRLNLGTNILGVFGRVFTEKTLASVPVGADALSGLETFTLGEDEEGWYHYAASEGAAVSSNVVARGEWGASEAPRRGREPGLPGEAGGAVNRTAVVFYVSKVKVSFNVPPASTKSRPFLPTELVRIRVLGKQPRTLIVTALEAAGLLDFTKDDFFKHIVSPFGKVYSIALAGMGLVRVFGTALAEGLMAGGLRGAATALGQTAATAAGRAALTSAALVGSMELVESYRGELQQTEAGREFLAAYDVASSILIARDVYHLLSAGLVRPLGRLALAAAEAAPAAGRAAVRRLQQELEALQLAWSRAEAAGELSAVEAATGLRLRVPKDPAKFTQHLMAARAEVASAEVVKSLSAAGRPTKAAEDVFKRLERLAERSVGANKEEVLKAHRAIANRSAAFEPEAAEAYLDKVKAILDLRSRRPDALTGFLHASARAADPLGFLNEVSRLASRKGLTPKTLETLGDKSLLYTYGKRSKGVDIGWLNTTSLSDGDLNRLGSDPGTSWEPLRKAIANITGDPPKYNQLPWVRSVLRGAAAETVAEDLLTRRPLPGLRVEGTQVAMGSSRIDIALASTGGLGGKFGLEVKGYTDKTFREAANAFLAHENTPRISLDSETAADVSKIDRMLKQLKDARQFTGNPPYLAISDDVSGPTKNKLQGILDKYVPGAEIISLEEAEIKELARRYAHGMHLPDIEKAMAQSKLPKP